jgi:glycosyltransferase involved in cell wall biosynthesis
LAEHNVEYLRVQSYVKVTKNPIEKLFYKYQAYKLKRFEGNALRGFHRVFSVSWDDLSRLQELCPNADYRLVPNAVDIEYFSPDRSNVCSNTIIWTGGAREIYNRHAIEILVRKVMPVIRRYRKDIKLVLIGGAIREYFPEVNGSTDIEILGYVDDVRPYLNVASIFVAPIFSGGGTKLKILNAMAMGLAVVTTEVGVEGIRCQEGVDYLQANSPEEFACKICDLFENPDKIKVMGMNARKFIERNYTWQSVLGKMEYSTWGKCDV